MNDETRRSKSEQETVLSGAEEATVLLTGEQATVLSGSSRSSYRSAGLSSSGRGGATAPPLEPGQTFGPYRVVKLLGRGGMGEVYEAEHVESGRHVAIKRLRGWFDEAGDRARFLQEGRLAASLSHPHTVYVFGSEEIDGLPVIAMQLVPGGTLKDRVTEHGPMPVAEAVAAVLDVLGGLDAAASAGILHRDIKPSNCFVDASGQVKVGDFGLSIPSGASGRTKGFQGTPQFAPPEQIRGDALDVRADIYAVGATLFYLVTGQAPFDGSDITALIERVQTDAAPLAHTVHPKVPPALAAVIAKCLAKDPAARPASHLELARLLRPFAVDTAPARLGARLVAWAIDAMIIGLPSLIVGTIFEWGRAARGPVSVNVDPMPILLGFAYYLVCEGRWQASLGKRMLGLRVVPASGDWTWRRASIRTALFFAGSVPLAVASLAIGPSRLAEAAIARPWLAGLVSSGPMLVMAGLFVTMRRRNGFAGVHEVVSGTRVVQRRASEMRRRDASTSALVADDASLARGRRRLGGFDVIDELSEVDGGRLLEGVDVVLNRRVWLIEGEGRPEVPKARRDVDRVGRLHWLAGRRADGDCWDAFEMPEGRPLDPTPASAPWSAARLWLTDLAQELAAAEADGTMPVLALDRVWVRPDGRVVLLDMPAPGSTAPGTPLSPAALLAAVGRLALGHPHGTPMPVSAVAMVDRWTKRPETTIRDAQADLQAVAASPDRVSRGRRLIALAANAAPLAMMMLAAVIAVSAVTKVMSHDGYVTLQLLEELKKERDAATRDAIGVYLRSTYPAVLGDESLWRMTGGRTSEISQLRALARGADRPAPTAAEVAAARAMLGPRLERIERDFAEEQEKPKSTREIVVVLLLVGSGMAYGSAVMSVLIRPSGLLLSALGLAVLTTRGRETGRLRAIWRLTLAWSPVGVFSALVSVPALRPWLYAPVPAFTVAALMAAGVIWTIWRPTRGPHDILAGTVIGVR